ncbi:hypothetical protein [Photorhabdus bodei]|uniref:Uncharacterized protein n=1 Tax=Photorhabdus bodei TaxID=2029681 RepID=A0ABX0ATA2_9GAMM|nr:hypothetical protein [Photorhabdus bodei]NDL04641.1 hypothetical protein [Photorhabdus bodei]NDL08966.1 hypothetical protein [Photorhabdus bodei]
MIGAFLVFCRVTAPRPIGIGIYTTFVKNGIDIQYAFNFSIVRTDK